MQNKSIVQKIINIPHERYRMLVWIYLFLLIFEGALRKWFLPGLATPLLLVREPIALYFFCISLMKNWFSNPTAIMMIAVATLSSIMTLIFGHQNLFVSLYGWRIYALDFTMVFAIAKVLNRDDVLTMGKYILYCSIPMTILITLQFYAPQSAWVNRGVGGDTEGAGFAGAMGYMRPPGTFSFTSGYVQYQFLVGSFLFYYLVVNNSLPKHLKINSIILWVIAGCYAITIPFSISRTHFFQTFILAAFLISGVILTNRIAMVQKLIGSSIALVFVLALVQVSGIAGTALDAFTDRFTTANEVEGGSSGAQGALLSRIAYSLFQGIPYDAPFWGYGMGLGTNAGAKLAGGANGMFSFFNAESEINRVLNECGILLGGIIIVLRISIAITICKAAYKILTNRKDLLLWMLVPATFLALMQGQWGTPTSMGFTVLLTGFAYTLMKKNSIYEK